MTATAHAFDGFELLAPSGARLSALQAAGLTQVDALKASLDDLFRLEFPFVSAESPEYEPTKADYLAEFWNSGNVSEMGAWAHYPWRSALVHLPDEESFFRMRTNRNRELVTEAEQRRFYESNVAVAGMSVGSSCATNLVLTGGARHLRIADFDELSITNLNRLPASVCDIGLAKTTIVARRLLELNPFLDLSVHPQGITLDSIPDFLGQAGPHVDVFVEEIDDVYLKIQSRLVARDLGIPVVMATDNGDNAIIDVERFDLEPDRPLFHGRVPEDQLRALPENPGPGQRIAVAHGIVGSCVTPRTQQSLQLIGGKLVTWPQLGTAATVSGAAVSFVVRQILTGSEMPSGRYHVALDAALDPSLATAEWEATRDAQTADFEQSMTIMFGTP